MKKSLLALTAMLLLASGAQAATTYQLTGITYENSFSAQAPVAGCTGCITGTAVDDGFGNIALTGIAWYYNAGGSSYNISFNGTTTLAVGTTLAKVAGATCVDILGTVCDPLNIRSGMGNMNFYTALASDGVTACGTPPVNVNAINRCRVDVSVAGNNLTVAIKRALSESATSGNSQLYTLNFTAVPVPAAVWLPGSALGVMGLLRRKSPGA